MKTNKKIVSALFAVSTVLLFTACNQNTPKETANSSAATSSSSQTTKSSTAASSSVATDGGTLTSKGIEFVEVSVDDALKAYQAAYGNTDVTSLELDSSFGHYYYKIEAVDDDYEYEIVVDATSKEVKQKGKERLDDDERGGVKRKEDKLDTSNLLSIEKAAEIAEKEAGAGKATDWDLDKELGTTYWEVKVKDGRKDTKVKLNAQTGEILEVDIDD